MSTPVKNEILVADVKLTVSGANIHSDNDLPTPAGYRFASRVVLDDGSNLVLTQTLGASNVKMMIGSGTPRFAELQLPIPDTEIVNDNKVRVNKLEIGQNFAYCSATDKPLVRISVQGI
jgi:hypothetical protein